MPQVDRDGEAQPDFTKFWVVGHEYISQEGTDFFKKLREEAGLTRENIETLSGYIGFVSVPQQMMFEDYPGIPTLDELVALAVIYDTSPGALIDRCFSKKGAQLLAERAADEQTTT